ncbi:MULTISPECIES: hypothetical protein [unclassified Streptomyces]|uniref:hypothetical protein n=1 Tax=unclassified Streptomyces TaxID=2593676 RepID=UPI000DBA8196|nr:MULTISPECIES: hypothetical protein [unclassified Streptomyces]MYT71542.1 hypothetical protein [Streptomyces sp. SID8367]RAJ83005.1 hypothetical protein K377_04060 [Streptomyces sp. PsTaAH-137]
MQVHRIRRHERDFTVIANKAIRDPRLSHTARGILVYVLSLPSGAQVNVRTLSDGFPQGRLAVSKAVKELRELGYWVTRTERDPRSKRIVSSVDVYELPALGASPAAVEPVPGRVGTGDSGAKSPGGEAYYYDKDGEKPPPLPPAEPAAPSESAEPAISRDPRAAESAGILRRLGTVDARLRLSERSVRDLVPEVCDWLDRGATGAQVIDAVTAGLPAKVYSAARLVADRLTRKRPARKRAWREVFECPECRDPLPWGQEAGTACRSCADRPEHTVGVGDGDGYGEVRRVLRERVRVRCA